MVSDLFSIFDPTPQMRFSFKHSFGLTLHLMKFLIVKTTSVNYVAKLKLLNINPISNFGKSFIRIGGQKKFEIMKT